MPITNYGDMTVALAGQIADDGESDIRSFFNSEATDEIAFGTAVVQGSDEKAGLVPSASDDVFVGIAARGDSYDPALDLGDNGGILPTRELNIMNKGRCWVRVGEAVEVGDRGYVVYATPISGAEEPGQIMKQDISDVTLDTSAQIKFLTAATSGGLAYAEIDAMNLQGASTTS